MFDNFLRLNFFYSYKKSFKNVAIFYKFFLFF